MRKVNYKTAEEKNALIEQAIQNGEYLIEAAELTTESYLIFDTEPLPIEVSHPTLEERISALEEALLMLLMEG